MWQQLIDKTLAPSVAQTAVYARTHARLKHQKARLSLAPTPLPASVTQPGAAAAGRQLGGGGARRGRAGRGRAGRSAAGRGRASPSR